MTLEEIKALMNSTGLPNTYYSWPEKEVPALPYLVYFFPDSNNFGADNHVYTKISELSVELYTSRKDPAAEAAVEAALDRAGIFWDKDETYIKSERMYLILYEMEVLINDSE